MSVKFNPMNSIVQLCMKGMGLEDEGMVNEAFNTFQEAWEQSSNDYEKFIAAYHYGLRQKNNADKLIWLEKSLTYALKIDDENVKSAYPTLYEEIAKCYEVKNDAENAKKNQELSRSYQGILTDIGPFYHGTRAVLKVGDFLIAGNASNYDKNLKMNHIYFTANITGAILAATLAKGDGEERVYLVEPTGEFEHDPNVTDKKFPGNLTRSYRSQKPLRILEQIRGWEKMTQTNQTEWHKKLEKNKGEIIN